ncbi:MAG TPA: transposase [Bacteroidales bacterium]|nr:transposase [Bacteroidales bacterium]HNZ41836.1 transposase [Bacteroidales bacterium]HOH83429.1 transposase [Bacteroidales bacterium]HPB24589.1 transposase [Bacteroidales bacterium]HPI29515.1 transposase [Bacteroidales bacterium]
MKIDAIESGAVYHIFNRGNNKENLFIEEKNYKYFISLMEKYLANIADIYCYCLMKNHFHLLLKIKESTNIAEEKYRKKPHLAFSHFFNSYTKSINKAYNRTGSLFQEHFHRNRITEDDFFKNVVAYIHLNPEKHGFVKDFRNYPHSSYADFFSERKSFIDKDFVINFFGNIANFEAWHCQKEWLLKGIIEDL